MHEFPHPELEDKARLAAQELNPIAPEDEDARFIEVTETLQGMPRNEAAQFLSGLLEGLPSEEIDRRVAALREQRERGAEAMRATESGIKEAMVREELMDLRTTRPGTDSSETDPTVN